MSGGVLSVLYDIADYIIALYIRIIGNDAHGSSPFWVSLALE